MLLILSFVVLIGAVIAAIVSVEVSKHPRGLYVLFGTEMWERFSYYGMRALLVLYLVEHLGWQPEQSSVVYKWYTSLVYLTPLIGGLLADRLLGLRASIITGAILMAIGQFLMAFEAIPFLYMALAFLIIGNGFFKPNISTLVGKMYTKDDSRRDGAFTIFYMGINLGAFLAPIWCSELRIRMHSFHWGFAAAGVGMLVGLCTFVFGLPMVTRMVHAAGNDLKTARDIESDNKKDPSSSVPEEATDDDKPAEPGPSRLLATIFPFFLMLVAVALPAFYAWQWKTGHAKATDLIMPIAYGAVFMTMAVILRGIRGRAKDKSVVIFVLFFFVVLFWMAFEQAGNALSLWAEFHTRLQAGSFHYTAESFQSVNPVFILALAPVFSILWAWLGKTGREPRTPTKMLFALGMMATSFGAMVVAAAQENQTVSTVTCARPLPPEFLAKPFDAGRLTATPNGELTVLGVLPHYVVDDIFKTVSPQAYVKEIDDLEGKTKPATSASPVKYEVKTADFTFPLDGDAATEAGVTFDGKALVFTKPMSAPTKTALEGAAAPKAFRDSIESLEKKSHDARVSGLWLLLSYLLATIGELCLSPVGLSMVTKLAPRRFASLFMGVWMLTSSVAQYAGGSIGESWGKITPTSYFILFVGTSIVGAVFLAVLAIPAKKLMHEVH